MNCAVHPNREVTGVCQACGRPVCPECTVVVGDQTYCTQCNAKFQPKRRFFSNGFIRTVLSICPGLGHLYIGLPQRGIQIFVGCVLATMVTEGFLRMDFGPLITFGFIFYSIFDSRELAMRQAAGERVVDQQLVDLRQIWQHKEKIGYGLIGLGALGIYRMLSEIAARIDPALTRPMDYMTFGIAAIVGGVYLLRSPSKSA